MIIDESSASVRAGQIRTYDAYPCLAYRQTLSSGFQCKGKMRRAPYDYGIGTIAYQCSVCERLVVEPVVQEVADAEPA